MNVHSHSVRRDKLMNRLNIQRQADRRDEDSQRRPALLCSLRLSSGLDAGDLRRGRHECRQPVSLFSLQGGADRRHRRAGSRRSGAGLCPSRPSQGLFAVLEGMAHHHFTIRSIEQVKLCTEVMSEARRNPEIARISASFDADVRKWLTDMFNTAAEQGDIPGCRRRGRGRYADDHRRRRLVAPRARSELQGRTP